MLIFWYCSLLRANTRCTTPRTPISHSLGSADTEGISKATVVLKILVGVGLGFLLFTNPEARQITADLLRATASAIAPEQDNKTFQDRVKEAVVEKVMDGN